MDTIKAWGKWGIYLSDLRKTGSIVVVEDDGESPGATSRNDGTMGVVFVLFVDGRKVVARGNHVGILVLVEAAVAFFRRSDGRRGASTGDAGWSGGDLGLVVHG